MEEFKETLIKDYVEFIYEGKLIYDFWRTLHGDDLTIENMIKQSLEHNILNFMRFNHILYNSIYPVIDLYNEQKNYPNKKISVDLKEMIVDKYINGCSSYDSYDKSFYLNIKNFNTMCIYYKNNINVFQVMLKILGIDHNKIIVN